MRKLYKNHKAKKNTAEVLKESLLETHSEENIHKQIVDSVMEILPNTDGAWQSEVEEVATL